jgi:hypothetical protein
MFNIENILTDKYMIYFVLIIIICIIVYIYYNSKNEQMTQQIPSPMTQQIPSPMTQQIPSPMTEQVLNETDIKIIRENIARNMFDIITVNTNSNACTARQNELQAQKAEFGEIAGDFNVNIGEQKKIKLNLNCVKLAKNDFIQMIMNEIFEKLNNKFNQDELKKLEADARIKAVAGLLPSNKHSLNQEYGPFSVIHYIIYIEIDKIFNTETLQRSLSNIIANQDARVNSLKTGNIVMGSHYKDIEIFFKAIKEDETINKTIDEIVKKLNMISMVGVISKENKMPISKENNLPITKNFDPEIREYVKKLVPKLDVAKELVRNIVFPQMDVIKNGIDDCLGGFEIYWERADKSNNYTSGSGIESITLKSKGPMKESVEKCKKMFDLSEAQKYIK